MVPGPGQGTACGQDSFRPVGYGPIVTAWEHGVPGGRRRRSRSFPRRLDRIQLSVGGDAPLAGYGGEEDPGVMDWQGEATVTVGPPGCWSTCPT